MDNHVEQVLLNEQKIMRQTLILTLILSILFVVINYILHPDFTFSFVRFLLGIVIYLVVSLLLVLINEMLNLLGYRFLCKVPLETLSFSIHLQKGLVYSKTTAKIRNAHYQSVFLTSFSITGIVPLAFAFSIGSYSLLLASASFIAGGLANFIGIFKLRKYPDDVLVKDEPENFLVHVFVNEKKTS